MALKLRLACWIIEKGNSTKGFLYLIIKVVNYFYNEILLGIEVESGTKVDTGLIIYHGYGIVVNKRTVIGKCCIIRNGVVLGNKIKSDGVETGCPVVGDYVEFGAHAIVIGPVVIGDNVKVGAGAVVTKNVPSGSVVAGNPAKIVRANHE